MEFKTRTTKYWILAYTLDLCRMIDVVNVENPKLEVCCKSSCLLDALSLSTISYLNWCTTMTLMGEIITRSHRVHKQTSRREKDDDSFT